MPFQLTGDNPGAILAGLNPVPDPAVAAANQIKLRQAQQEASLFPVRAQMAQEQLTAEQIANQERRLDLQEADQMRQTFPKYVKPDGTIDYAGAMGELAGKVRPKTLQGIQTFLDTHGKNAAETAKFTAEADEKQTQAQEKERQFFSDVAAHFVNNKDDYTPQNVYSALTLVPPKYAQHAQQYWQAYQQNPDAFYGSLGQMVTPETKERLARVAQAQAQTEEAKQKAFTGRMDIASRTVPTDLDAPDFQQRWAEWWKGLDPELQRRIPQTGSAAAIDRAQKLGVPAEKVPEWDLNAYKAKMGLVGNSEYDQFLVQFARALGKTPKDLTPQEGLASFQKFAEFKQDPVMRANAIAMKQLTEANLRLQQGLMPTPEDIQTYTTALLNHKLSPTQFNELKSKQGNVAGKVFTAAMQADPNFSPARAEAEFKAWEKTEADFTSGKEAGLVRSNNNAIEHLALLDEARKALNNGDMPALQRIANYFGTATGGSKATVYDHIAARVGDEVQKAFIPGGGSAGERQAAGAGSYNSSMGDKQNADNIRADIALMDSQQRHLLDQYTRGTYGQGSQQLFTPEAQAARDRLLGRPSAAVRGVGGQAPPLPAQLSRSDIGKTYVNRQGQQIKVTEVNPQNPKQFKFEVVQ